MMNLEQFNELALDESRVAMRLLRAALHTGDVMRDLVALGVNTSDFLAPGMQLVWDAMLSEWRRVGRIDMTFLRAALHATSTDGDELVSMVLDSPPLDSGVELLSLMTTLRRRVALHRLRQLGSRVSSLASALDSDPRVVCGVVRAAVDAIGAASDAPSGASGADLSRIAEGIITSDRASWEAIPLGLPEIDNVLGGGIPVGRCSVIMAGSGVGKTTYARHVMINMLRHLKTVGDGAVLYVTFESDREEVARELVQMLAGERLHRVGNAQKLGRDAGVRVSAAAAELATLPLVVEDGAQLSAESFVALVRSHARRRNIKAVVLDYVQDLDMPPKTPSPEAHARTSTALRVFASQQNIALLNLSQVSAEAGSAARDKVSAVRAEDTAGSKKYAKDAAIVISVERKHDAKDEAMRNISRVRLLKNRVTGSSAEQWMRWAQRTTRLTPCDSSGNEIEGIDTSTNDGDEHA